MQSKKRVNLTLNASTLAAIDEVKAEGQEYATWIRSFLEEWENTPDTL